MDQTVQGQDAGRDDAGSRRVGSPPAEGRRGGPPASRDVAADPLLDCLRVVARIFGRPTERAALLAGLPVGGRPLSHDLFLRAAERVGIRARGARRSLGALVPLELPAVLLLNDGRPVVLLEIDAAGFARLEDPRRGGPAILPREELEAAYSGDCFLVAVTTATAGREASEHWLWGVARRYWRSYLKVVVASAVVNVLALASTLFIMNVYDRVLPNQAFATLWVLAIGVMLAFVFDFVLRMARAVIVDHVGRRVDLKVSSGLFERILNAPLQNRPESTGAFANRVAEYEFVRDFFTAGTLTLAIDMVFAVLFLAVIYALAGWAVLVPVAGIAVVLLVGLVVQHLIGSRMAAAQEQSALRHSLLVEAVGGIETVKSLRGEGSLLARWDGLVREGAETQEGVKRLSSLAATATSFVQQAIGVGIVIVGVYRFAEGAMSMGAIIATVILANRATAPLGQLSMMLARARHALQSLRTLDAIMALPDERDGPGKQVYRRVEAGEIEFRDVEFSYPGSPRKTLNGASFRIRPGERVGVIGRIGSGKTTIGRLMAGLYHPSAGEVLVDGVDLRQYHSQEIRSAISLVVQDADLFHGSVRSNLLLANGSAEDFEIVRAAQLSGLDQIVTAHPMGFEMPVGEKGQTLSGGQRQLLSLARALVSPFKVLFLDEPTSAMDTMSERALIERLKTAIEPGRTFILCTHRHSALALVDRLLVVDGGRIVADGPREEVLRALQERARAPAAARRPEAGPQTGPEGP